MRKNHRKLYWIFLIFIIPILASRALFHFHDYFNFKTTNHGALVSPAMQVSDLALPSSQPKHWQIIYMPKNCCDDQCDKMTFTLHQLRLALGKDRNRVDLTLAIDNSCKITDVHDFRKLMLEKSQFNHLQNQFDANGFKEFQVQNKIYLVDPVGNLFMFYTTDANPMNILKDLKRVLEVSQIG